MSKVSSELITVHYKTKIKRQTFHEKNQIVIWVDLNVCWIIRRTN